MVQLANRRSVMTFYSDSCDAASHAVRFVLSEKAINVEIHNILSDDERPDQLNELNPYNSILTLVDRELVLYEEQIIMEYLDERFPHPPLMPVDPVSRANNRLFRYRIKRDIYNLMEKLEADVDNEGLRRNLRDQFTALAPVFMQRPYFMSDDYSLVDCFLAPLLWRMPHYDIELPAQVKPLLDYADRLFKRDSFQASLTEEEREMR